MEGLIASGQISIVLGLGRSGMSVAQFMAQQQNPFWALDDALNQEKIAAFELACPGQKPQSSHHADIDWSVVKELVLSPGISREHAVVQAALSHKVPVVSDIDLFCRYAKAPIIAITGSNGKSTVTTLVGQLIEASGLKAGVGGNIGIPALSLLASDYDFYVLELSSFQLESTHELKARVSTILNISPDHMDRYASIQDYHRAKQRIYMGAAHVVPNKDDPLTEPPLAEGVKRTAFSLGQPDLRDFGLIKHDKTYLAYGLDKWMPVDELKIRGTHNYANALAALAIGQVIELPKESMLQALRAFPGLPHRCEWVQEWQGVTFVNDSKATNVGATIAALEGLASTEKNIVLIVGGDSKGGDLNDLKPVFKKHVKAVFALGADGPKFAGLCGDAIPFEYVGSLQEAVAQGAQVAQAGDMVLLSPACSSLDMFASFEQRGKAFGEAVAAL